MSIITTDLVALDVDAGGDKEAVIGLLADRLAAAGRTTDRDGLDRRRDGARGAVRHRTARRHRHPTLPLAPRRRRHHRLRPALAAGRLRRTRRSRRPRLPDRGAGIRWLRAHEAAVQPGTGAGAQGLRRIAAQRVVGRRDRRPGRRRGQPRARCGARRGSAGGPGGRSGRSSPSPPAPPASRTPTWPPTPWSPPARRPASTCRSRRRAPRAARRCPPRPSPPPPPSSSPPTSASRTEAGSRASRSSRPASSVPSTSPTRWWPKPLRPPTIRMRRGWRAWQAHRRRQARPRPAESAGAPAPGRSCSPASAT